MRPIASSNTIGSITSSSVSRTIAVISDWSQPLVSESTRSRSFSSFSG